MIFAKPRHEYASYTDFWAMVDLCGYPTIYQDEIDSQSDNCYIFTGADAHVEFEPGKARIIYWLLEWYTDYQQKRGVTETWCSNRTFADMVGGRFVPMGSHAGLGTLEKSVQLYDLAHLSYDGINRRRWLLDRIREQGYSIAPNGWGKERERLLKASGALAHIHQSEDAPAIAPLRASIAAAYGLPLIAENGWSIEPYGNYCYPVGYDAILTALRLVRKNPHEASEVGRGLHDLLCDTLRFDRVIEAHL